MFPLAENHQRLYSYRIDDNGEFIRVYNGNEERTGFYYVRGGRLSR